MGKGGKSAKRGKIEQFNFGTSDFSIIFHNLPLFFLLKSKYTFHNRNSIKKIVSLTPWQPGIFFQFLKASSPFSPNFKRIQHFSFIIYWNAIVHPPPPFPPSSNFFFHKHKQNYALLWFASSSLWSQSIHFKDAIFGECWKTGVAIGRAGFRYYEWI